MVIANNIMSTRPVPSSKNMPADDDSKASADSSPKRDPDVNWITPESRLSTCSTLAVDVGSEASAGSRSKWDSVVNKIMPASRVSKASAMPVDVGSKASAPCWGNWDPTSGEFFLAAGPQEGYRFPPYLGYADSGPCRVGAVFSSPGDLDTFLGAPKVMPDGYNVCLSDTKTVRDKSLRSIFPSSPTAVRQFSFQKLEHHKVKYLHELEDVIDASVRNKAKQVPRGRRRIYVITELRIAEGLEVSDGESRWKFDGRVIFSYRMQEAIRASDLISSQFRTGGPKYKFERVYPDSKFLREWRQGSVDPGCRW
ncbi:unnamed protein product [Clonostachys byssicola]|uniref:Uncharacterized protein n=1 Tax=Clonostachys byssicola TaxID=160290 RepID=A0A9N9Y3W8_9HYPO|nr:unnamed protein product [Clonostachys byssicola]